MPGQPGTCHHFTLPDQREPLIELDPTVVEPRFGREAFRVRHRLQDHIHLGAEATSGGISAYLCRTTQTAPAGTPDCDPGRDGTVSGTIEPADVIGPTGQGIAGPADFGELLRAIRAGVTYANVHSSRYPRARSAPSSSAATSPFRGSGSYGIWTPEIAREITRRWISDVPSKIV